jgi:hypothetical protein
VKPLPGVLLGEHREVRQPGDPRLLVGEAERHAENLELLVKDLSKAPPKTGSTRLVPHSICERIDAQMPRLRFLVDIRGEGGPAFLPHSGERLERVLYFLLGEIAIASAAANHRFATSLFKRRARGSP